MKKLIGLLSSAGFLCAMVWGCSDSKSRYVDLTTGEAIEVDKDDKTGYWINTSTKEPVYIYVDTKNNDTIFGRTGKVINGRLVKQDGKYVYDDGKIKMEGGDFKDKDDDIKVKVEADGDTKIKTDEKKIKIENGVKKVKYD